MAYVNLHGHYTYEQALEYLAEAKDFTLEQLHQARHSLVADKRAGRISAAECLGAANLINLALDLKVTCKETE